MRRFSASPVVQFALAGLVAVLGIGLIGVLVIRHVSTNEAIRDAKQVTRLAGQGIVAPHVTAQVLAGNRAALGQVDRVVRDKVLGDGVVRVKIWDQAGRIVYSDEPRLIGTRYRLAAEDLHAFTADRVAADVSDLSRPENRFERSQGKLLEVYLPIRATSGQALLFESYQRYSSVSSTGHRLSLAFAPVILGGLLLLQFVNLPLAGSLARRLRRGQREREALLEEALDASQGERRRIAADLHDGVVQDLVGVSYTLAAQAERLHSHDPDASAALRDGASTTRDSVRALRTLLVDIYPPSLHNAGLDAALGDLARTYSARGLQTSIAVEPDVQPSEESERLLFRVAQEALRNAHKHAHAQHVSVTVRRAGDSVVLEAIDDGRGFDPAALEHESRPGHLGFVLLRDRVGGAGGRLGVQSAPGEGTTVRMELPA